MKVYLLYDYAEYGPEHTRATLDPAHLPKMIDQCLQDGVHDHLIAEAVERMAVEVDSTEPDPDGRALIDGWGGLTLLIVELES
jgi:hypothetical protein